MVDRITPWLRPFDVYSYLSLLASGPEDGLGGHRISLCDPPPNVATLSNSLSAFHHCLSVLLAYEGWCLTLAPSSCQGPGWNLATLTRKAMSRNHTSNLDLSLA